MERTAADIGALAFGALLAEVAATPKPGLVDRLTNGAHRDMDFSTFLASACALRHTFDAFAAAGVAGAELSPPALFPRLREIGLAAEQAMFRATDGVNTHKGMIFSLGLLAASAGLLAARGEQLRAEAAGARAAAICAEACARASAQAAKKPAGARTKGERICLAYGYAGARGEAQGGYRTVLTVSLPVYRKKRARGASVNDALADTLLHLIAQTVDTNILGRHDPAALAYAQEAARQALAAGGVGMPAGRAAILALDADFTRRWISPGGSADLLAVTHFLYELERL